MVSRAVHGHQHRRRHVETRRFVGFGKPVNHRGHVLEKQARTIASRKQDKAFIVLTTVGLTDGPQQDLAALGAHGPTRQVQRRTAHGAGHVVEPQPVASQRRFRDFDADLVGPSSHHLHLRDLWQRCEPVTDLFCNPFQREFVRDTGYRNFHHLLSGRQFPDDRLLGFPWKSRNRIDTALDVVNHFPRICAELELCLHDPHPLVRGRGDLLDAVNSLDRLLDSHRDARLDLLRCGAEVRHLDRHHL